MPLLMSLEGPRLGAIDEIRAELYGNIPKRMWKVSTQLNGLRGAFDPFLSNKLVVLGGIMLGFWLAGSTKGRALVSKYTKKR